MKTTIENKKLPLAVALAVGALVPVIWLATVIPGEGLNLPSDDAWIHQVFARNLAREGRYEYNPGERSTGVTAPLWTMVLSETYFLHLPPRAAAVTLTAASHVLWAGAVYWLVLGIWPGRSRWWATSAACLFALLGPVAWFSVSGMETSLFFALATLAAAAFGRRRHALAGFAAAAAVPLRPEGALLVAMLFAWWVITLIREDRRPYAGEVVGYVAMPLLFNAPFVVQNWIISGVPFPTTYFGRHWLYLGSVDPDTRIVWSGPLVLAFYWYRYIHVWMLGQNEISNAMKTFTDPAVLSQLGLWAAVIQLVRRRLTAGFAFFIIWVILHNLFYGFVLPNFGTAGRYEGCNFALLAIAIVFGAQLLLSWLRERPFKIIPYVFLAAAFVSAVGSYLHWRIMYGDNIHHITTVHGAAGKWAAQNLPADARVAAFDIGIFGYYADRYIIDIGGLLDRDADKYLRTKTMSRYLKKKDADYVVMMGIDSPDIIPLPERLGFYRDEGRVFQLEFLKSWNLNPSRGRWINVTAIAYPRLSIYKIHFLGG
jgi:hypothetical protein